MTAPPSQHTQKEHVYGDDHACARQTTSHIPDADANNADKKTHTHSLFTIPPAWQSTTLKNN